MNSKQISWPAAFIGVVLLFHWSDPLYAHPPSKIAVSPAVAQNLIDTGQTYLKKRLICYRKGQRLWPGYVRGSGSHELWLNLRPLLQKRHLTEKRIRRILRRLRSECQAIVPAPSATPAPPLPPTLAPTPLPTLSITPSPTISPTPTLWATASPTTPSRGLRPIARWDAVPYQRINQGQTLNLGVVGFSKAGIDRVEFAISGQGYAGTNPLVASYMTHNPQTGVFEYWVPIAANSFSSSGPITVEATVYGKDGGIRDKDSASGVGLDPLILHVNPTGLLPLVEAWVDLNGNDSSGMVNDSGSPFRTIGKAIDAARAWRDTNGFGNNADGAIVRLNPGTHSMSNGGIWTEIPVTDEWVTLTTAAGGNRANTILQHGNGGTPKVKLLKAEGLTLKSDGQYDFAINIGLSQAQVWVNDCDLIGAGKWVDGGYLTTDPSYYTNSHISNVYPVAIMRGLLARGLTLEHIGCDAFTNIPLVVNSTVDDIDPGTTGCHSDAFQLHWVSGGPAGNVIIYNYRVTNADSQSIFVADASPDFVLDGAAVVNVYMNNTQFGSWGVPTNHFVFWHDSLVGPHYYLFHNGNLTNLSMVGNVFNLFLGDDALDFGDSHDNHFIQTTGAWGVQVRGANATTGDPQLDAYGKPTADSPLRDRVTELAVPVDGDNQLRGSSADVGAYEYIE